MHMTQKSDLVTSGCGTTIVGAPAPIEGLTSGAGTFLTQTKPAEKMRRVWRVKPDGASGWLHGEKLADIIDVLDAEADLGDTFRLECTEMSEEAIANAGEFDGW